MIRTPYIPRCKLRASSWSAPASPGTGRTRGSARAPSCGPSLSGSPPCRCRAPPVSAGRFWSVGGASRTYVHTQSGRDKKQAKTDRERQTKRDKGLREARQPCLFVWLESPPAVSLCLFTLIFRVGEDGKTTTRGERETRRHKKRDTTRRFSNKAMMATTTTTTTTVKQQVIITE